jgi:hypothetical protein
MTSKPVAVCALDEVNRYGERESIPQRVLRLRQILDAHQHLPLPGPRSAGPA